MLPYPLQMPHATYNVRLAKDGNKYNQTVPWFNKTVPYRVDKIAEYVDEHFTEKIT